jgi:hypothetical protein
MSGGLKLNKVLLFMEELYLEFILANIID